MTEFLMRFALFTVLPVLLGGALVLFDRTANTPLRKAEAFLVPLFLVGVGGGGIAAFIAQVFIAEPASALLRELGFANLALALLGAIAADRRDGFREATVVAAAVFGIGAVVATILDSGVTGETLPGIARLAVPALLAWFLFSLRRAEAGEEVNILLYGWMIPLRRASVGAVAVAAAAFAVGSSTGWMLAASLGGVAAAIAVFWFVIVQAATHRAPAGG
jgi:hypothetical protein